MPLNLPSNIRSALTAKLTRRLRRGVAALAILVWWPSLLFADSLPVFELTLKDHLFSPSTLQVPAGTKIKIIIHNRDPNPEEFESFSMNREKVILGNSSGVVFVGPLQPGTYPFSGEYNPDSAKGQLIALPEADWKALPQAGGKDAH